ncbi:MAG: PadR family transcriptional regulator [Agathobacter sp.]|nr:PadR family transcriptional regulator [Agathobacter sp.]
MTYKNSLITGITDLLVLSILKEKGDSYVYEINNYIANSSNKLLPISHNTIYTVMYKLEEAKMISEYSKLVGKKRTRVYYHIEPAGEAYLNDLNNTYNNMITGVSYIFDSLKKEGDNTNE